MTAAAQDTVFIGIAGLGTVGKGLAEAIALNADWTLRKIGRRIAIKTVLEREMHRDTITLPAGAAFTSDAEAMLSDPDIAVVVELMGGIPFPFEFIKKALEHGKHVVTANKALLAERGGELFNLAAAKGLGLYYEASVCGAIPIVHALKEGMSGNRIDSVTGILNGTANYILSRMSQADLSFDAALREAQEQGFAEADPTLDVEGLDAAHKLILLIRLAFGLDYPFADLPVTGITRVTPQDIAFAREFGCRIKLIGQAVLEDGLVQAGVHPMLLDRHYLLAGVEGAYNAVRVEGNASGPINLHGKGAGGLPTGGAVLGDVIALAKDAAHPTTTGFFSQILPKAAVAPAEEHVSGHYIRFNVADRPGVMAAIAGVMGELGISIAKAVQKGVEAGDNVPIVFLTHKAKLAAVNQAIAVIGALPFIAEPTMHLRVL